MPLDINRNIITSGDTTKLGVFDTKVNIDGLVLYWDAFDFDSSWPMTGTTSWLDLVNLYNNGSTTGVLVGSPTWTSASPGYITLNGSSQYIQTTGITISGERSFFLWIYYGNVSPGGYSLSGIRESSANTYIGIANGGGGFLSGGTSGGTYAVTFTTATWYNVGFTLNSDGIIYVYTNGQVSATMRSGLGNASTANFQVGAVGGANFVNGRIGQVLLYNKALNPFEVAENFSATRDRYGV